MEAEHMRRTVGEKAHREIGNCHHFQPVTLRLLPGFSKGLSQRLEQIARLDVPGRAEQVVRGNDAKVGFGHPVRGCFARKPKPGGFGDIFALAREIAQPLGGGPQSRALSPVVISPGQRLCRTPKAQYVGQESGILDIDVGTDIRVILVLVNERGCRLDGGNNCAAVPGKSGSADCVVQVFDALLQIGAVFFPRPIAGYQTVGPGAAFHDDAPFGFGNGNRTAHDLFTPCPESPYTCAMSCRGRKDASQLGRESETVIPAATMSSMPRMASGVSTSPQISQDQIAEAGRMTYSKTETVVACAT